MKRLGKGDCKGENLKKLQKTTLLKNLKWIYKKSKTKGIITMRKLTPMRAIRQKCLDCCCFSAKEVALCTAVNCPLYSYRLGHKPSKDNNPIDESNTEKNAPTTVEKENVSV